MKALYFRQHGSVDNLDYGNVDTPVCEENEILIRVKAASINHLDLWVLNGWPGINLPLPHIGGSDVSGEISAVGESVSNFKIGERVMACPGFLIPGDEDRFTSSKNDSLSPRYRILGESVQGGFAEYVKIPASACYKIPEKISFENACASLLVGLTSYRMLVTKAKIKKGDIVLIVGAGGGVNSFSIQLSKHYGAKVIALTSSDKKMQLAKELGADYCVNYLQNSDWYKEVYKITKGYGVDIVIDNVGEKTFSNSLKAVTKGGAIVTVGNTSGPIVSFDNRLLFAKQVSILGSTMGGKEEFENLLKFIWSKDYKPVIDRVLPLSEGKSAYEILQKGDQFGKIILVP